MPPPFKTPSHRPTKKRRRGPPEEEGSSKTRMSWVGQIQRCSNCGVAGHKRRGCPKPLTSPSTQKIQRQEWRTGSNKNFIKGEKEVILTATSPDQSIQEEGINISIIFTVSASRGFFPAQPEANQQRFWKMRAQIQAQQATTSFSAQLFIISAECSLNTTQICFKNHQKSLSQPTKKSITPPNSAHISPKKLMLMAKLPPRKWGNI
ncbi:hypothetical protein PIB30_079336 [Stylosanthes scabra]|uniref:CCHC-type domain-containing protein n=1 Tax=Stylosanthes scabra TaxID=79078 RepID=A0ABU6YNQ2_9FABA|nr:hypothetical protein [Stylosanthes scabra]